LGAAGRAVEAGDPARINTPSTPAFDELSSHRRDHSSTTSRRE
jgi:hypothetical protein